MDNKENNVTNSTENISNLKQYKWDIYLITVLIILIILFPFGILWYIWGRMNLMVHFLVLAAFALWFLILVCLLSGIIRFFEKNIWKKRVLILIEICLSAIFFISYFIPFDMALNLYDSSDPFLCGYRDRIRSRLDIKAIREWMKTYNENNITENNNEIVDEYIFLEKLPECLKPISYGGAFRFRKDWTGNPIVEQLCGATFTSWSLHIGMEDMPYPDSEFYKEHEGFWLPVAPGIYVDMY